jgi:hypothetical protein
MNFEVLKEKRGVMSIIKFIFEICEFKKNKGFDSYVEIKINDCEDKVKID